MATGVTLITAITERACFDLVMRSRPGTAAGGFDAAKIRTVAENANTLKFDQSEFEEH